ncbi:MFS transporter [Hyphomonas pacifica]|nr:MFS transporter [Hyphomonas pacifica]
MTPNVTPGQSERSSGYYGWKVLFGAAIGLAFSPGPVSLVLVGALAPSLGEKFGWGMGQVMFSLTLLNLGSVIAAPLAGRLLDKIGARALLFSSLIMLAISVVGWGVWADTLTKFYAVAILYGVATIGAQSLTYNKLLTTWFDENRGIALGVASSGLGLGYTFLPLLVGFGIEHYGAVGASIFLALMIIVFPLAINVLVAHPRPVAIDEVKVLDEGEGRSDDLSSLHIGLTLREAASTPAFWCLAASIFLVSVIATGIVPQFRALGRDLQYSPEAIATVASVFGFATLGGRLLVGWLFDRFFAPRVTFIFFVLAAIGYALAAFCVINGSNWPVLTVAVILMGLGFGAESDLVGYLASRYFGIRHFGAIYGCLLSIFILGAAAGPFMYGVMRDQTGGYGPVLLGCAVAGLAAAFILLLLPRFPEPADLLRKSSRQ